MPELEIPIIKERIKTELIQSGTQVDPLVEKAIKRAVEEETSELAKDILLTLLENYQIGKRECLPICQDTGTVVVFMEIGEKNCSQCREIENAINEAIREVWQEESFRASIVQDPLFNRINTKDNTPAVIHTKVISGEGLRLTLALKGGGAENMSALKMLTPSEGADGIKSFVLETVLKAGGKPCPPIIISIGIGGNFETCPLLAKRALFRELGKPHPMPEYAALEAEILQAVNQTGIGPQGLGGKTTALAVQIETAPCHIASLPVAVNLDCHAHRHITLTF
ncbi:MAG TPA: fumarate hydratase [Candidatus Cloacimonadota bacterium]|nr:fumarate hydratase [Candidatus Cloacimonadota bacterium]